MGEKNSKLAINVDHPPILSAKPKRLNPDRLEHRLLQNVFLLWLDNTIDLENTEWQQILNHFRERINDIVLFTNVDACMEFLDEIHEEKIIIITSGSFGQTFVPIVHNMDIIEKIYVYCHNRDAHKKWIKAWPKVKDAYTTVKPIAEDLPSTINQCNEDLTPFSFIGTDQNKNFDATFTYTQLFKKILLDMTNDDQCREAFLKIYSIVYADNTHEAANIKEFYGKYDPTTSIRWYTRLSFLRQILNRVLRLLEADIIVDMAFLIRDIHQQLKDLHEDQFVGRRVKPFTVYRGQGMSEENFAKLKSSQNGFMSCNSFFSACKRESYALQIAQNAAKKGKYIGLFFIIKIDPNLNDVTFANITKHGYEEIEPEYLFSMHTRFHIESIKALDKKERIFEIKLELTEINKNELRHHLHLLEKDIAGRTASAQLAHVLIKIGEVSKAEELYSKLLEQAQTSDYDRAIALQELGRIKELRNDCKESVRCYEEAIMIQRRIFSPKYPDLVNAYGRVGQLYWDMGDLTRAVSSFEEALRIQQRIHLVNDTALLALYKKIGSIYIELQQYSKALPYFGKVTQIQEQSFGHGQHYPDLIASYNSIATIHSKLEAYDKALFYYEKALELQQKILPPDHPTLAQQYFDMGNTHMNLDDYAKAMPFFKKALKIKQKILPPHHPELGILYNNMGSLHNKIGQHEEALSCYERDLEICLKILPENHPDLITSYSNIGGTYYRLEKYREALIFFEKALHIGQKSLPSTQSDVEDILRSIELVKSKL